MPCNLQFLAPELLSIIFEFYQASLPLGTPPILISHVCSNWRRIIHGVTARWTTLTIRHTSRPDVLKTFLEYSRKKPLHLYFDFPFSCVELWPVEDRRDFHSTFTAVRQCLWRTETLYIYASSSTTRIILNNAFNKVPLTALVALTLIQHPTSPSGNDPISSYGPLVFNPNVFAHLHLDRFTIETSAQHLSGLRSLSLTRSSGALLDHEQLMHPDYPTFIPAPAMPHLTMLSIDGTSFIVASEHVNAIHAITPSFGTDALTTLRLARMHVPEGSPHAVPALEHLLRATWGPNIRHLILDHISEPAMRCFLRIGHYPGSPAPPIQAQAQHDAALTYVAVTKLTLRNMPWFRSYNLRFALACPNVEEISLEGVDPKWLWPIFSNLVLQEGDVEVWPKVKEVRVDGVLYPRHEPPPQRTTPPS